MQMYSNRNKILLNHRPSEWAHLVSPLLSQERFLLTVNIFLLNIYQYYQNQVRSTAQEFDELKQNLVGNSTVLREMRNSALVQRTNYLQTKYSFVTKISTREEWVANSGFRDHAIKADECRVIGWYVMTSKLVWLLLLTKFMIGHLDGLQSTPQRSFRFDC